MSVNHLGKAFLNDVKCEKAIARTIGKA